MNARQKPVNIDGDIGTGIPFRDGLRILARIISRVYRWNLFISRLYITSNAAQAYIGTQTYFEWSIIGVDGDSYLVTATWCY